MTDRAEEIAREIVNAVMPMPTGSPIDAADHYPRLATAIYNALRALEERARKAEEDCKAVCDSYADENQRFHDRFTAAEARVKELEAALRTLTAPDCAYHGSDIVIPAGSHGNAIATMRAARSALGEKP